MSSIEFVHQYSWQVRSATGEDYAARVYATPMGHGPWEAWFVFFPMDGGRPIASDRETTQSTLEDVTYWATGISPVYLEGSLERAIRLLPEARLARSIAEAEREEAMARAEAESYERAAEAARSEARAAAAEKEAAVAALERVLEPISEADDAGLSARTFARNAGRRSSSRHRARS